MKERGISQRVSKITSIDTTKKNILDALNYSSELIMNETEKVQVSKVIKLNKMRKYRELVEQIKPVVKSFSLLKETHKELLKKLHELNEEIGEKVEKSGVALKNGKSFMLEIDEGKWKGLVIEQVLDTVKGVGEEGDSVMTALGKVRVD